MFSLPLQRTGSFASNNKANWVSFVRHGIFQRYACVVIDVFFSVYRYSGVFICNPDRHR